MKIGYVNLIWIFKFSEILRILFENDMYYYDFNSLKVHTSIIYGSEFDYEK